MARFNTAAPTPSKATTRGNTRPSSANNTIRTRKEAARMQAVTVDSPSWLARRRPTVEDLQEPAVRRASLEGRATRRRSSANTAELTARMADLVGGTDARRSSYAASAASAVPMTPMHRISSMTMVLQQQNTPLVAQEKNLGGAGSPASKIAETPASTNKTTHSRSSRAGSIRDRWTPAKVVVPTWVSRRRRSSLVEEKAAGQRRRSSIQAAADAATASNVVTPRKSSLVQKVQTKTASTATPSETPKSIQKNTGGNFRTPGAAVDHGTSPQQTGIVSTPRCANACHVCEKTVYFMERLEADKVSRSSATFVRNPLQHRQCLPGS